MNFIRNSRKIVCVGRNYAEHAKELNNPVPTTTPLLFLKPTSSFLAEGKGNIEVPPTCKNLHYELELGVVIGKGGRDIPVADSMSHVSGWFLGLDMTAREIQDEAKKQGHPWSVAKGYDTFAPVSQFIPFDKNTDPSNFSLTLKVNDVVKQDGVTSDMIFTIPFLISYISSIYTLEEGDCIFTGTPKGVGPTVAGDTLEGVLKNTKTGEVLTTINFKVASRAPRASL